MLFSFCVSVCLRVCWCVCLSVYICLSVCLFIYLCGLWRRLVVSWNISVSWNGRDNVEISWWLRLRENIVKWTNLDWRLDSTDSNSISSYVSSTHCLSLSVLCLSFSFSLYILLSCLNGDCVEDIVGLLKFPILCGLVVCRLLSCCLLLLLTFICRISVGRSVSRCICGNYNTEPISHVARWARWKLFVRWVTCQHNHGGIFFTNDHRQQQLAIVEWSAWTYWTQTYSLSDCNWKPQLIWSG